MNLKTLSEIVVSRLKELYPEASCALEYGGDPFRLLVMARLSAQCTDKRVNLVSKELFERFPNAEAMANASVGEIENLIKSCGLYHTKAKDIKKMSEVILSEYNGKVPESMEDLLRLSGVGRKIANLMRGDVFGEPSIVTDTHCIRICGRLGFYPYKEKNPYKIEKILSSVIEESEQSDFCHRIVMFGREYCAARSPKCDRCIFSDICKSFKQSNSKDVK